MSRKLALLAGVLPFLGGFFPTAKSPAVPRRDRAFSVVAGEGTRRAKERLRARQRANEGTPNTSKMTRQRLRAEERRWLKETRITPAEFARRKIAIINKGYRHA
jgi:hypothetical protein